MDVAGFDDLIIVISVVWLGTGSRGDFWNSRDFHELIQTS